MKKLREIRTGFESESGRNGCVQVHKLPSRPITLGHHVPRCKILSCSQSGLVPLLVIESALTRGFWGEMIIFRHF